MAKHMIGNRRVAVCAWLTANGINPNDLPQDADVTIQQGPDGRVLRCETYDRTPDGHLQPDERNIGIALKVVTVPLKAEPPEWWEPYEKPTRADLLAALGNVQQLAERWKHTGDRKNGPRQELLTALGEYARPEAP